MHFKTIFTYLVENEMKQTSISTNNRTSQFDLTFSFHSKLTNKSFEMVWLLRFYIYIYTYQIQSNKDIKLNFNDKSMCFYFKIVY